MYKNRLQLTKLRITLRFQAASHLPSFVGNTLRGALGRALSQLCCEWDSPRCDTCNKTAACVYGAMFKAQSSSSIPNPYVISAPFPSNGHYKSGDKLAFFITLFGSACIFERDVLSAAESMCTAKLKDAELVDAVCDYSRQWSDEGAESIVPCDKLTVHFMTPTEIRIGGEAITEVDFATLTESLFGRITDIIGNYTEGEFVLPYRLSVRKPLIQSEYNLKKVHLTTSGQPIDAILGTISYFGDVTRYLPYIDLGTQLHIGKKTTRGCGEYVFEI